VGIEFQFATAGRVVFGSGEVRKLGLYLEGALGGSVEGKRALVVTGSSNARAEGVLSALRERKVPAEVVLTRGEPTVSDAERALAIGQAHGAHFVVGVGGGSALDLAKVTALLLANGGPTSDYLEVIGKGKTPQNPALPTIAVPTTAGTGAEVTKNGVLLSEEHHVKVSLRHDSMLPRLALVDPELTMSVPRDVTAATGLDALTQCIEPYLSAFAGPLTDGIALQGILAGARSLRAAIANGADLGAREGMALCSLFGGLSLANARLGAVHGIAGPFGGMFVSPHGAVCARLLPLVLRENLGALRTRAPFSPLLPRFDEIARLLTQRPDAKPEDGILWVEELVSELQIPRLAAYGMGGADIDELLDKAEKASSMKGNPLVLTRAELTRIVAEAM
jgi:alcohol dehydrogenase class IV